MLIKSPYIRMVQSSQSVQTADPGSRVAGPTSAFHKRLQEGQHALDTVRSYGVFDAEPSPGFRRTIRRIESMTPDLPNRVAFPVLIVEDRSETERHIAILARRPLAVLIFKRQAIATLASSLVLADDTERLQSGVKDQTVVRRERIVFYSFHLPILPEFGCVVRRHTGRRWRMGYDLTATAMDHVAPYALTRAAISLESDIADILGVQDIPA